MTVSNRVLFAALLFGLFQAGCSAPRETAVVTERAVRTVRPPSTETVSRPRPSQDTRTPFPAGYDTVSARRFDAGKMWTFDNPPARYFEASYGFTPDDDWFERARLGALRFSSYCSASFVSPNGLVMTNHHCGRESITEVTREGEHLLDEGFYAASLVDERKVKGLYVDQLIGLEDVTKKVYVAGDEDAETAEQAEARVSRAEALEKSMTSDVKSKDSTLYVQVVSLYNGGRYSAYTYRRFDDVRLVMSPELKMGFFGGDPDNFTFPRYSLDMSFFRVYGSDGRPLSSANYFPWSSGGIGDGDPVFVVGNPGTTERLNTISQLEYERDYELPHNLAALHRRSDLLKTYMDEHPDEAKSFDLINTYFSIRNSIKASEGQKAGLADPYLIARRTAAERDLQTAVEADADLKAKYGSLWEKIRQIQLSKIASSKKAWALTYFANPTVSSHVLTRAMYAYVHALMKRRSFPPERIKEIYDEAIKVKSWPADLEKKMIALRLRELLASFGEDDPTMKKVVGRNSPEAVADSIMSHTVLADSVAFKALLDGSYLGSNDGTVDVIQAIAPLYFTQSQQLDDFKRREKDLDARLARLSFRVKGDDIPPDASFSLRIADGRVKSYAYNGTKAAPFSTFYGLFDRHYSFPDREEWSLPDRWLNIPENLDLGTPMVLVSTNDITGGNSGSPLLNKDLEVVGLVFDGNIESLPNQYLYTDDAARAVAVDARGIIEALSDVYGADRLVKELRSGRLAAGGTGAPSAGEDK